MTDINENWEARGSYLHKKASRAPHWHADGRVKRCIACQQDKPLSDFSAYAYTTKQGKRSTRYESRCLPCNAARRMERYAVNGDQDRAATQGWRNRNRDKIAAYNRQRQGDSDHRRNKAKAQRLRKARMRSGGGDSPAIKAIYAEAMRIEAIIQCCPVFDLPELGKKMHVDHIRPLSKGGAHHEDNLQILPIGINMRKGVRYGG